MMKKIGNILFVLVSGISFGLIGMAIFSIMLDVQKTILGLPDLEKRVIALEIEADQKAGLYKENE